MARWSNQFAVLAALGVGLTAGKTVKAQDALAPDWVAGKLNERGQHCDKRAEQRAGNRRLLACGAAGVWEVAIEESGPRLLRSYEFPGEVTGFFSEPDGRLWVKLQVQEARPFVSTTTPGLVAFPDATPPAALPEEPPTAATVLPAAPVNPPPSPQPSRSFGSVLSTRPGQAVISLGSVDGISRSDHIEFSVARATRASGDGDGDGDDDDGELSRESVAVGVVTTVTEHNALVRLGLNEAVPTGARANPTRAQLTASLSTPPRVTKLWHVEFLARPFAALDELGGGVLLSGSVGYRFAHLHLQALIDPLAIADVQGKRSVKAASGAAIASYDSQYFEMGLGFGGQTVNEAGFLLDPGSGYAVLQTVRLGALDGLSISARTNVVLFHSQFQFGGMVASGQIPVTRGYWLLLDGGGGNIGYGYGELGLRVMLEGNGLAGSRFLTVTAGGAALFRSGSCPPFEACNETLSYGGPMAGIGYEARF